MTLKISLRDGEKLVVNGAVLRSVGRAVISVESRAAILRGRDVISREDATTPGRRLYHACITAYTDPDHRDLHQDCILAALSDILAAMPSHAAQSACASFAHRVAMGDYYRALAACRDLIALEREVAASTPTCAAAVEHAVLGRAPA